MKRRDDAAFRAWIAELRTEAGLFYSKFDVVPECWRDDFDKGLTAAESFGRIMDAVFEPMAHELAAFERRKGAALQ